jgi:ankyrin repeat protein
MYLLPAAADLTDLYEHAKMPEIVIETINNYDARGKTPLLYAASVGHLETLMNILQAGADVNKPAENTTDTGQSMIILITNIHMIQLLKRNLTCQHYTDETVQLYSTPLSSVTTW